MGLTLEPANVFLLLLNLNVIGDHVGKLCVDTPLVQVALQEALQVLVQVLERRTCVQTLSCPVLLGSLGVGKVRLVEVRDLLNLEQTVLGDGLDQKSAVAGLFDSHVDTRREARLHVTFQGVNVTVGGSDTVLSVLGNVTARALVGRLVSVVVHLVRKSSIIEILLFAQVLKVGNGEGEADSVLGRRIKIGHDEVQEEKINLLLVTKLLGEHNLLVTGNILDLGKVRTICHNHKWNCHLAAHTSKELFWRTYWMF